jgi:hypothetical protein
MAGKSDETKEEGRLREKLAALFTSAAGFSCPAYTYLWVTYEGDPTCVKCRACRLHFQFPTLEGAGLLWQDGEFALLVHPAYSYALPLVELAALAVGSAALLVPLLSGCSFFGALHGDLPRLSTA